MTPKETTKVVHFDDDAQRGLAMGVKIMRQAVGSTYGPGGRNVLIKKKYVDPILTRDGVTVARDIAGSGNRLEDDDANIAARLVYQASEKTNKTAGDGTTHTVVLLADVYEQGRKLIAAGADPMVVKRSIERMSRSIVEYVESKSVPCTEKMLTQVAQISSGNLELGKMIADLMWDVGADGTVTINYHNAPYVEVEKVAGYSFDQGVRFLAAEVELIDPLVLVCQRRIATRADIIPILELMAQEKRQFIIVGDVSGPAQETLFGAIQSQQVDGLPITPPAFGQDGFDFFKDIATYTGANLILENQAMSTVTLNDFGVVKSARIKREGAVLFGAEDPKTNEAVAKRLKEIEEQKKATDVTPSLAETLEQRYAKLAGKVSVIKVGAATENGREELFFRVEDAVEACKSALSSGVVAGGATTLLHASKELELEPFIRTALQSPFRLLMSNAAEDGGLRLQKVLEAGYGQGYDLRDISEQPIDLFKTGIVDPTKVITQAVINAFENAGNILTAGTTITEAVKDESTSATN